MTGLFKLEDLQKMSPDELSKVTAAIEEAKKSKKTQEVEVLRRKIYVMPSGYLSFIRRD